MEGAVTPEVPNDDALRELDRLQEQLASRRSVVHFAHSAVSMVLAIIVSGAAGKLFWDLSVRYYLVAVPASALALALATYSVVRYVRGKRLARTELEKYRAMIELRRALRLDDPSALLPR